MLANHHSREWMVYNKTDEHVWTIIISIDIRVVNSFLVSVMHRKPWKLGKVPTDATLVLSVNFHGFSNPVHRFVHTLYAHTITYFPQRYYNQTVVPTSNDIYQSYIIRSHHISSGIIRYHQISSDIIRYHQISSDTIWYHLISSDTIWYHLISFDIDNSVDWIYLFFSLSTVSQERQRQQSALQRSNAAAEASASAAKAEAEQKVRRRFSPVVGVAMSWDINILYIYIYDIYMCNIYINMWYIYVYIYIWDKEREREIDRYIYIYMYTPCLYTLKSFTALLSPPLLCAPFPVLLSRLKVGSV